MAAIAARLKRRLRELRRRYPPLDHAVRAYQRADEVLWGRLAGSITYFAFLSLFPVLALGFSVLGYLTVVSPDIRQGVENTVASYFPGLLGDAPGQIDVDALADARRGAGVLGILGLVYAGTGAVDALRDALRQVFGARSKVASLPVKKLRDVLLLVGLGVIVVSSVAVSSVTTQLATTLLSLVGLAGSAAAQLLLRALALLIAVAVNTLFLAVLFRVLSGVPTRWRDVRTGAAIGALGLEVLKLTATLVLGSTFGNPLYAGFAVLVGLLVWINFSARVIVLAASWAATEPAVRAAVPAVEAVSATELQRVVLPVAEDAGSRVPWRRALSGAVVVAAATAVLRRRGA